MTLPYGNYAFSWFWGTGRHVVAAFQANVGGGLRQRDGSLGYLKWLIQVAGDRRAAGLPLAVFLGGPEGPLYAGGDACDRLAADYNELASGLKAAGFTPDLWVIDSEYDRAKLDPRLIERALVTPVVNAFPAAAVCVWAEAPVSAAAGRTLRSVWSGQPVAPAAKTVGTINNPCDYLFSGAASTHRSPLGRLAQAVNGINGSRQADPDKRICAFAGSQVVADAGVTVAELEAHCTHMLVRTGGPVLLFDQDDSAGAGQRCRDAFDRVADRLNAAMAGRTWKRQLRVDALAGAADKTISSVAELDDGSVLAAYTTSYTRTKAEPIASGLGWTIDMPLLADGSKTAITVASPR